MKKILTILVFCSLSILASAQCSPGGGVTCTSNYNLWKFPNLYQGWGPGMDANMDTLSGALVNMVFDVTSSPYGADKTGVADSLAAVEAAMTAACANSGGISGNGPAGIVYFPPGVYKMSGPIPNTASLWCRGLYLRGAGWISTTLKFNDASGYAINIPAALRYYGIDGMLISVGGGSGGSNNEGAITIGDSGWYGEFKDLYIIAPSTDTSAGINTNGTSTEAFMDLLNVRIDGFGGSGGHGFYFTASGTGAHLHIRNCYSFAASVGFDISFYFNVLIEDSSADTNATQGFFFHPGAGNSITAIDITSEGDTGNAFQIGNSGGTVILKSPKTSGFNGASGKFPFEIINFTNGQLTIEDPVTTGNTGTNTASLDITGTSPQSVTITGGQQYLDKGLSAGATSYLNQLQGNLLSNGNGGFSVIALGTPGTPTVTCAGACSGGTWGYKVVGFDALSNPTAASAQGTATNATTLTSTNKNTITWNALPGAVSYNVYRTASAGTPANLSLLCTGETIGNILSCVDDGSVNTSTVTPSAVNSTGNLQVPAIKSTTGQRFVCVDTNGNLVSSASACSGT